MDSNLQQVVDQKTRGNSILDLLFTNFPDLVQNFKIIPGISSDHNIVEVKYSARRARQKKPKKRNTSMEECEHITNEN